MADLRSYQVAALASMADASRHVLRLPPGAGKTAIAATWSGTQARRSLVVVPNVVIDHWHAEFGKWARTDSTIMRGTPQQRAKIRAAYEGGPLICSYEIMRGDIDHLLAMPWDAVIFDESHRLKDRTTITFKSAVKLARRAPSLSLITGTPIINRADELWTSLHMIDHKAYASFWRWAREHFHVRTEWFRNRPVEMVGDLLDGHADILHSQLGHRLIDVEVDLGLEPPCYNVIPVKLSAGEREAYETMRTKHWMEVGDELVIAPNRISTDVRLRQLSSDWSAFDPTKVGAKVKAAAELVKDLVDSGEQVVVFCAFKATVNAMLNQIEDIPAVAFSGDVSQKHRTLNKYAFIDGNARVMVATLAAVGEAVDGLQSAARHAIFIDREWTPARNEQAVGRLHRTGQERHVQVWDIVARDTMDQVIAHALTAKADVIQAVLRTRRDK